MDAALKVRDESRSLDGRSDPWRLLPPRDDRRSGVWGGRQNRTSLREEKREKEVSVLKTEEIRVSCDLYESQNRKLLDL